MTKPEKPKPKPPAAVAETLVNDAAANAAVFDSRAFLEQATQRPGVYQMLAADESVLYVGKAKNLKNRLSSYFRDHGLAVKTRALVNRIADIQITVTGSETEALLLEQNLIKEYRPPYNVLLRDDKSYLYVFISADKPYPRLAYGRGKGNHQKGRFFGPFPSAHAAKETLVLMQKMFHLEHTFRS